MEMITASQTIFLNYTAINIAYYMYMRLITSWVYNLLVF